MVDDLSGHHCPQGDLARLRALEGSVPGLATAGPGAGASVASSSQAGREAGVASVGPPPGGKDPTKFDRRAYQRAYMRKRRLKADEA